jgi:hypothetical protein
MYCLWMKQGKIHTASLSFHWSIVVSLWEHFQGTFSTGNGVRSPHIHISCHWLPVLPFFSFLWRHYATTRQVAGSIPDEVQPHYGPGVDSASDRNEYQESSWG